MHHDNHGRGLTFCQQCVRYVRATIAGGLILCGLCGMILGHREDPHTHIETQPNQWRLDSISAVMASTSATGQMVKSL